MEFSAHSIGIICLLLSLTGFITYGMKKKNDQFLASVESESTAKNIMLTRNYLRNTTYIYLFVIILCVITIIALDWQYTRTRKELQILERRITTISINTQRALEYPQPQPVATGPTTQPISPVASQPAATAPTTIPVAAPTQDTDILAQPPNIPPPVAPQPAPLAPANASAPAVVVPIAPSGQSPLSTTYTDPADEPVMPQDVINTATAPVIANRLNVLSTSAPETELPPANAPAETPPSDAASANAVINEVYNPEQSSAGDDPLSAIDDIKKRYEDIMVLHMFMKRCQSATDNDYNIISAALAQEISDANAPGKTINDITEAAKGSYEELYSQSDCNGEGMADLRSQYTRYILMLEENFLRAP